MVGGRSKGGRVGGCLVVRWLVAENVGGWLVAAREGGRMEGSLSGSEKGG